MTVFLSDNQYKAAKLLEAYFARASKVWL